MHAIMQWFVHIWNHPAFKIRRSRAECSWIIIIYHSFHQGGLNQIQRQSGGKTGKGCLAGMTVKIINF